MTNTLNQHYEEKVRPCIDLIDSLRSLGVEQDLALPAIAVIGDQSSGKSSVLEALSGVALPRGNELKMKRTKAGQKWSGKIKYRDYSEDLGKPAEVDEKIRKAQEVLAGKGCGISHELISLAIASPDIPDLTLIDLPGIARVAVKGQPENIGEQIKTLIRTFIAKQETINLVVVPCNVDIATTEALQMAQEVDPEKKRTLGVLTKPDLVDKGAEKTVIEIVQNKVIVLKKGYMVVKCRGQKDILDDMSLNKALKNEQAFFRNHQRSLPQLEDQIKTKLAQTNSEMERCGEGPPAGSAERISFLIDKVTAFTHNTISLTSGEEINHERNLYSTLRKEFGLWKKTIEDSGITFSLKLGQEVAHYDRMYRGRELPGFINYKMFERVIKEQIKLLEEPAITKLQQVSEMIKKEMLKLAQESFEGFPNLIKTAKIKIEDICEDKEAAAEAMLRTQFQMEMIVYTQDGRYGKKLGKRKRTEANDAPSQLGFSGTIISISSNSTTLKEMMTHLKSYYNIAGQRLADYLPMVIRYQLLQESSVELQRQMLQSLQNKEEVEDLLKEDCTMGETRTRLQQRHHRLHQARSLLSKF
uniref:Interferon-induced GTP-binding protein Mx n=1 Tax=Knipowitschia caucasica TaxID=637954 RepID=A0AAV2M8T9_KNICA